MYRISIFLIFLVAFYLSEVKSQAYKFHFFDIERGLPEQFIYDLVQDDKGYLWIATGSGLARFDGYNFEIFNDQNGLQSSFINKCFIDSKTKLWLGHKDGIISYYHDRDFHVLEIADSIKSIVNDIKEDQYGNMWFASQNDGLLILKPNGTSQLHSLDDFLLYSIYPITETSVLLGTSDGMYLYDTDKKTYEDIDNNPYTKISVMIKDAQGNILIGTEDEGLYFVEIKGARIELVEFFHNEVLKKHKIQDIYADNEGDLWVSTFGGGIYFYKKNKSVYEYFDNYNSKNGLSSDNVKTLFQDHEGNIWIGTYGEGLATLVEDYFTFYKNTESQQSSNITALYTEKDLVWLGTEGALLKFSMDSADYWQQVPLVESDMVTSIYRDIQNNLWLGLDKQGLLKYDHGKGCFESVFLSEDRLVNSVNFIDGYGNYLWIATKNGIVKYNTVLGESVFFNTSNGLPHNNINHLFVDINENVWVSTQSNDLYVIKSNEIIKHKISNNSEILKINAITEDQSGKIWIATYGNGVYVYNNNSFKNFNTNQGLMSNYCYSIMHDENDNIWVGHRMGISRINNNGLVKTYGKKDGIMGDCNKNAIHKDKDGCIWIGTTQGIVHYNYQKDRKNEIPPVLSVRSITFSDKKLAFAEQIEMPYSAYKLSIDFIGISHTDPSGVRYKYMLKGYDLGWSETYDQSVTYNRVEDGDYVFMIMSCNSDGVWNDESFDFKISIQPPVWKKAWFIILCILIIAYLIYLVIKIRERNHRKLQEYLQKTLDERTKEVVEQKEKIEIQRDELEDANRKLESKNKDITDSINYAQRIQEAIFPSRSILTEVFPDSFIFYRPRDIVSGDFYWFEKIGDRFIVICADATGHGVPGAFMSLISITMIKDFVKNLGIDQPSMLLKKLDIEIRNTLNQKNQDLDHRSPTDGLDVSICEINLKTKKLKFASAMRPLYLYANNELKYYKGTRYPVGGGMIKDKKFEEIEFDIEKGNIIYLFSDGYPDQFGGPLGKKMKMARFRNILNRMLPEKMHEQCEILEQEFDDWRGNFSQIDDVLFIGIKIS